MKRAIKANTNKAVDLLREPENRLHEALQDILQIARGTANCSAAALFLSERGQLSPMHQLGMDLVSAPPEHLVAALISKGLHFYFEFSFHLEDRTVGLIMVADQKRNKLSASKQESLAALARLSAGLLNHHREKSSQLSEDHFFTASLDLLATSDSGGYFTRVNPVVEQILGYTPEEFCSIPYLELVHPEDIERTAAEVASQMQGKGVMAFENRYRCKDGSYKWMSWKSSPVGNVMYGCGRDVTAEHEYRAAIEKLNRDLESSVASRTNQLMQTAQRFEQVVSSNMIGIIFWNTAGQITEANAAFLNMVGYSREDLLAGRVNWMEMTPSEHKEIDRIGLKEFAEHGVCKPYEKEYIKKDGSRVPIFIGYAKIQSDGSEGVCFILDRTDTRRIENERKELHVREQAAQARSQLKSEFLANMSHEIRTPINGVMGMMGLLSDTNLQAEQREFVEAAKSSAETLLTVINDILDFSKVEAGKLEFEDIDFQLPKLLEELEKSFLFQARTKKIQLLFDVDKAIPEFLGGDPGRLRQVLNNLLSNAIKFSNQGAVQVRVRVQPESSTKNHVVRFEVTDKGVGISAQTLPNLFQAFSQADASMSRKFGGTGLGLSISKHLVEKMNGEIGVESVEGKGSTFWFTVQLRKSHSGARPAAEAVGSFEGLSPRPFRILVAEDNSINQKIALRILEKMGLRADAVGNGKEAIEAISTIPYDLILMDCQMPELDGYEATKAIRANRALSRNELPIIAMTANAMAGERERCLDCGMNDYVSKPAKPGEIYNVLRRWLLKEAA